MGVNHVGNAKASVKTVDVNVSGKHGKKLSKPEEQLAKLIAGLDGKGALSKSDLARLQRMKPDEQIRFINNALKGTGYKVANVYDNEADTTTKGVRWTSNGVFINFSENGKTINVDQMGQAPGKNGHLGITYKK